MPSSVIIPIAELKGYVDSCNDAYQGGDDTIPWSMMEVIQKKIDAIFQQLQEGH